MRERNVEAYFKKRVAETGGLERKVQWIGRRGAPDRFAAWPAGKNGFVELKAPDEQPRPEQLREHLRLQLCGVRVDVIDTCEKVDAYVEEMSQ